MPAKRGYAKTRYGSPSKAAAAHRRRAANKAEREKETAATKNKTQAQLRKLASAKRKKEMEKCPKAVSKLKRKQLIDYLEKHK